MRLHLERLQSRQLRSPFTFQEKQQQQQTSITMIKDNDLHHEMQKLNPNKGPQKPEGTNT